MAQSIDLIFLTDKNERPSWSEGNVYLSLPRPGDLHEKLTALARTSKAPLFLVWDDSLEPPDPGRIRQISSLPGNVWHAGLALGTAGLPDIIDYVWPDWMLNRDAENSIECTSWRISLRACLIQKEVIVQLGDIRPEFQTLDAAALEMGLRYITRGVFTRCIPWMLSSETGTYKPKIPLKDSLRFMYYRSGMFWSIWTIVRILLSREKPAFASIISFLDIIRTSQDTAASTSFIHQKVPAPELSKEHTVSVLIPTVNRYAYLSKLLPQFRKSTVKPVEIIIVDQTPQDSRQEGFYTDYADLPINVIYQDNPGQCSSRNEGLHTSSCRYILFLDDDDEIPPTIIEDHLNNLHNFRSRISCGVCRETGAGPLPENFTLIRTSDVFPANNSMIDKRVLYDTGLFDMAYNHGSRADGDLGMRLYLKGNIMVLNPEISVLHHHAPSGGLRTHDARKVTYAGSRKNLFHRHLPATTEIYLVMRYFSRRQVREMLWQRTFGTFRIRGSIIKRALKFFIAGIVLPHTLFEIRNRYIKAKEMLKLFPVIPDL